MAAAALVCVLSFGQTFGQTTLTDEELSNFASDSFEISLTSRMSGTRLSEVPVRATLSEIQAVNAMALARALDGKIKDEVVEKISQLPDGYVPVSEIEQFGVTLFMDQASLELVIEADETLVLADSFNLGLPPRFAGMEFLEPAMVAGGLTGALVASQDLEEDDTRQIKGLFDGFLNVGGVRGFNLDYAFEVDFEDQGQEDVFQRGRVLGFFDDPERAIRYGAGDSFTEGSGQLGSIDIFGLSAQRLFDEIQPERTIRRTGRRTISLDRRGRVEVYVNGTLISSFVADAGELDLSGIPFADINNRVEIVVEDELGRRQVTAFNFGSNLDLLQPGIVEFSANIGVLPDATSEVFGYSNDPAAAGFVRVGLTEWMTGSLEGQASEIYQGGTAGVVIDPGFGVLGVDAALTRLDDFGTGFSVRSGYEADFTGPFDMASDLRIDAEYISEDFALLGEIEPSNDVEFRLLGDYRTALDPYTSISVGGGLTTSHNRDGSERLLSLGLSRRIGEVLVSAVGQQSFGEEEELSVFLGLTYSFGERSSARATFDSPNATAAAEVRRSARDERGDYGYVARVENDFEDNEARLFGSGRYIGNRMDAEISIDQQLVDGELDGPVATARLQAGIAFADGKFAIGRDPALGFYLIDAHESLDDVNVGLSTGLRNVPEAETGLLGPAFVPVNQSYRAEGLRVIADDLPAGYDIGPGAYVARPGARSGYAIDVGSENFRTAVGELTIEGVSLALAYLTVRKLDDESWPEQQAFTNREGMFAVGGLGPGSYVIELDGKRYAATFEVGADAPNRIELGKKELERK